MSRNPKYMAEQIAAHLIGCKIVGCALSPDTENPDAFGLRLQGPTGAEFVVWVDSDAEGNDSGWLELPPSLTNPPKGG
jgi:hypothetical protein